MTTAVIMGIAAATALLAMAIVSVEPAYGCLSSDPILGCIGHVGFNFPPRGYAFCDGQLLSISQFSALFSLFGTTYGGDGRTTFGLPDARGRTIVHPGTGPGLDTVAWGQKFGSNSHVLTVAQMPSHTHALNTQAGVLADSSIPTGDTVLAKTWPRIYSTNNAVAGLTAMHANNIGPTGGNQAFDLEQPSIGMYCVVALQGIFPSQS